MKSSVIIFPATKCDREIAVAYKMVEENFIGNIKKLLQKKLIYLDYEMSNILLTGIGGYLPKEILTNNQLDTSLNSSDEWIKKRTGITQRHIIN